MLSIVICAHVVSVQLRRWDDCDHFQQYHPWALAVTLAVIGIFLDQLGKWFVLTHVFSLLDTPFEGIGYANALTILPFFNVVTVWNYGVSFGLFHTDLP